MNEKMLIVNLTPKQSMNLFNKILIDKTTGCWNWIGGISSGGYGTIRYKGRTEVSHRLVYAWLRKSIPRRKGKYIPQLDHVVCQNRKCCNPFHLELVTFKINILRGKSPSAIHARQTHCKNGHELPKEPNYIRKNGRSAERICLICRYNNDHSPKRIEAKKRARYIREHGKNREEYLKKHRECEKQRRLKLILSQKD